MKILHLDSSINYEFSVTRQLTAEIVKHLTADKQGNQLTYRDLIKKEITHLTADIAAGFRPVAGMAVASVELESQRNLSEVLVREFL